MRPLIEQYDELQGKTIERAVMRDCDQEMWLLFSDGTAAIVGHGYYNWSETCELSFEGFTLGRDNLDDAESSGMITREEADAFRHGEQETERTRRENAALAERREYERLKAKYG